MLGFEVAVGRETVERCCENGGGVAEIIYMAFETEHQNLSTVSGTNKTSIIRDVSALCLCVVCCVSSHIEPVDWHCHRRDVNVNQSRDCPWLTQSYLCIVV